MPVLKVPDKEAVVLPIAPHLPPQPIRKVYAQADEKVQKRVEQLSTACHMISVETRRVKAELYRQGIRFPEIIEHVLENLDNELETLKRILDKSHFIPAQDADNQEGRVDPRSQASADNAQDGRSEEV